MNGRVSGVAIFALLMGFASLSAAGDYGRDDWTHSRPRPLPRCNFDSGSSGWHGHGDTGTRDVVVCDADDRLVGVVLRVPSFADVLVPDVTVVRTIDGTVLSFEVGVDGIIQSVTPTGFETVNLDCSGEPGTVLNGTFSFPSQWLIRPLVLVHAMTGYYRVGPPTDFPDGMTFGQVRFTDQATCQGSGGTFTPPDRCCTAEGPFSGASTFIPYATVDLGALGLVPPFHVEAP